MLREILTSNNNNLIIRLPDDLVGKRIEVIAFEVVDEKDNNESLVQKVKPSELRGFLSEKSAILLHNHINQSRSEWDTL